MIKKITKKSKYLTQEQVEEIENAFLLFDKDASGSIDIYELKDALKALGIFLKKEDVKVMMVKVDRASMKNSLELRSRFIDHNLIEYVLSVESNYYYKTNNSKLPLKNYLQNDFEDSFLNRKKQGFGVPIAEWLLNDIDKPKETSIIKTYLISENSFTYARFSSQINELIDMLGKNKSSARRLWRLISFEIWFKKYKKYI